MNKIIRHSSPIALDRTSAMAMLIGVNELRRSVDFAEMVKVAFDRAKSRLQLRRDLAGAGIGLTLTSGDGRRHCEAFQPSASQEKLRDRPPSQTRQCLRL